MDREIDYVDADLAVPVVKLGCGIPNVQKLKAARTLVLSRSAFQLYALWVSVNG